MIMNDIHGLVLAGGRSSRMGRDKAALEYDGRPQTIRAFELLRPYCVAVYLSNRRAQAEAPGHAGLPQIHDTAENLGPLGGILAAFDFKPEAAWLVVACDLPFLDANTLAALIRARDRNRIATAFKSAHDSLPEPLCALYEPECVPVIRRLLAEGIRCPRKIMLRSNVRLLDPVNPVALDNINFPAEYERARQGIGADTPEPCS